MAEEKRRGTRKYDVAPEKMTWQKKNDVTAGVRRIITYQQIKLCKCNPVEVT